MIYVVHMGQESHTSNCSPLSQGPRSSQIGLVVHYASGPTQFSLHFSKSRLQFCWYRLLRACGSRQKPSVPSVTVFVTKIAPIRYLGKIRLCPNPATRACIIKITFSGNVDTRNSSPQGRPDGRTRTSGSSRTY